ncbi:MAG: phosphoribosylglycinamide formyltransferase [Gemmatimonadetes bacterium]|nr:phosphoribosylglycinamide formyltransferase [Gemmatimonadota bacterium]
MLEGPESVGSSEPMRVAVLASGGGSNLQALLDRFHSPPGAGARVELVIGSRPGLAALARAEAAGVANVVVDPRPLDVDSHSAALLEQLDTHRIELVILAGYLHLVPARVVERFHGRMLNIHPALLPAFGGLGLYGVHVHRAVIESGARVSGATVHLVDEQFDTGRILAQWPVPVLHSDTPAALAARVLRVEHQLLPAVVEAFASGRDAPPLLEPIAFELVAVPGPSGDSVRRLIAPPPTPSL